MASYSVQGKKLCTKFTLGECTYGNKCKFHHDDNLRPDVLDDSGWQPPPGETCARCALKALPCDKAGRDAGSNDPCSECRHFGGDKANCVRQGAVTMNSAQWQLFTSRERQGFDLPEFRSRDETAVSRSARPTSVAEAMGSDKIKPGWQGETREMLLAKPDLLTEDIRRHPRKYFHPPGLSKGKEKALAKNQMMVGQLGQAEFDRRRAQGTLHDRSMPSKELVVAAASRSPTFANFPPALESPLFLNVVGGGSYPADTMTWSYIDRSWKTVWSRTLLRGEHASGTFPSSLFRPEPHAHSGEAVSATWLYEARRWKITWADDSSMTSARFAESTQVVQVICPMFS
jgi:hypothetical protein